MAEVAEKLGLTRGTLDNYLSALSALELIAEEMPGIMPLIEGQSATAVATIARWLGRDRAGLEAFFKKTRNPTLRQVLAAERAARAGQGGVQVPVVEKVIDAVWDLSPREHEMAQWMERRAIDAALGSVGVDTVRLIDLDFSLAVPDYASALGLMRLGRLREDDEFAAWEMARREFTPLVTGIDAVVGVVEVAARTRDEQYRREARQLWRKLVASATVVQVVIVLFPDARARDVVIPSFPVPPKSWWKADMIPDSGVIRPLNGWGAVALLTTPETLFADWAGQGSPNP